MQTRNKADVKMINTNDEEMIKPVILKGKRTHRVAFADQKQEEVKEQVEGFSCKCGQVIGQHTDQNESLD
jgi:hypothetical protein